MPLKQVKFNPAYALDFVLSALIGYWIGAGTDTVLL